MPDEIVDQQSSAGDAHTFLRKSYQAGGFKMMSKESAGYEIETAVAEGKGESIADYAARIGRQMSWRAIQKRDFEMDALPGQTPSRRRRNIARAGCYVEDAKASKPGYMGHTPEEGTTSGDSTEAAVEETEISQRSGDLIRAASVGIEEFGDNQALHINGLL